jgi:hypothetical protein
MVVINASVYGNNFTVIINGKALYVCPKKLFMFVTNATVPKYVMIFLLS